MDPAGLPRRYRPRESYGEQMRPMVRSGGANTTPMELSLRTVVLAELAYFSDRLEHGDLPPLLELKDSGDPDWGS